MCSCSKQFSPQLTFLPLCRKVLWPTRSISNFVMILTESLGESQERKTVVPLSAVAVMLTGCSGARELPKNQTKEMRK